MDSFDALGPNVPQRVHDWERQRIARYSQLSSRASEVISNLKSFDEFAADKLEAGLLTPELT